MNKAKLFLSMLVWLCCTAIYAGADIPYGVYYLKNVETGKYLNQGNCWGFHAVLNTEGLPARVEEQPDGSYLISFTEGSRNMRQLFRDDEKNVYVDYAGQENGCPYWTVTNSETDGIYYIQSLVAHEVYGQEMLPGTYLGNNPDKEAADHGGYSMGVYNDVDGDVANEQGMNIRWQFVPENEYVSPSLKKRLRQLVDLASLFGVDTDYANVLLSFETATTLQLNNAINEQKSIILNRIAKGVDEALLPLDLTCLVENASFDRNNANGWEGDVPQFQVYDNAEFFQTTFDIHQTISGLPSGEYKLLVKGFHRPGTNQDVFTDYYVNGVDNSSAMFYANDSSVVLNNQASCAQKDMAADGGDVTSAEGEIFWVPNSMSDARRWFDKGYYDNGLTLDKDNSDLTFGIRLNETCDRSWVIFDEFRLFYNSRNISGTYYLYNPASGKYFSAGNDYGTRASLSDHGLDVKLTKQDSGKYLIDTGVYYEDGGQYLGIDNGAAWCDRPAEPWTLSDKGDGTYTMTTDGNRFLGFDGSTTVLGWIDNSDDANARWQLVTREERLAQLNAATDLNPVDVTFLLPGANFSHFDLRNQKWQGEPVFGGDLRNYCAEKFNTTFDVWQEIDVPNGMYKVQAQGFYREGGNENLGVEAIIALHRNGGEHFYAEFYANGVSTPLKSIFDDAGHNGDEGVSTPWGYMPNTMDEASHYFSAGLYENELSSVKVTDGKLRLGIRKDTHVDLDWAIFDNFRLTYYGEGKRGDVNKDGVADVADIAYIISAMAGSPGANKGQADVNDDGVVDVADIASVISVMAGK